MKFYRFESQQQFQTIVGTCDYEFSKDGVPVSVVGRIPAGTESMQWVEVFAPDSGSSLVEVLAPDYLDGWHVNALSAFDEWEDFEVSPQQPVRIFA